MKHQKPAIIILAFMLILSLTSCGTTTVTSSQTTSKKVTDTTKQKTTNTTNKVDFIVDGEKVDGRLLNYHVYTNQSTEYYIELNNYINVEYRIKNNSKSKASLFYISVENDFKGKIAFTNSEIIDDASERGESLFLDPNKEYSSKFTFTVKKGAMKPEEIDKAMSELKMSLVYKIDKKDYKTTLTFTEKNIKFTNAGQIRNDMVEIDSRAAGVFWNDSVFASFKDSGKTPAEYKAWLISEAKAKGINTVKLESVLTDYFGTDKTGKTIYPVVIDTAKYGSKDCFILVCTWGYVASSVTHRTAFVPPAGSAKSTVAALGHISIVVVEADSKKVIDKMTCN